MKNIDMPPTRNDFEFQICDKNDAFYLSDSYGTVIKELTVSELA